MSAKVTPLGEDTIVTTSARQYSTGGKTSRSSDAHSLVQSILGSQSPSVRNGFEHLKQRPWRDVAEVMWQVCDHVFDEVQTDHGDHRPTDGRDRLVRSASAGPVAAN